MTEERITETRDIDGTTPTHTTIVRDEPHTSGGGGTFKWIVLLLVLMAAAVVLYMFSQAADAEVLKDEAITQAAGQVGNAAQQAGDAVENVADEITGQ